ncbi:TonB-dependent hemoglobin/transferrin/lactoferrin family receptor [Jiella marina]|uniref:TonB-dependent hemoglobin/transferrin/lactoferrin family receptor n=1 Tax=Jiella sp. LLJ827 TaxID=2917712 RepID=UPI002101BE72|nr:TonB-dependent hemoglobin/transferrin/lactoferrin family receptor [Jiella sp. LLJ827]MCQ0987377.1 TonB-dependent hemoglobin/transferrin/lactoferrin family receptor [Jiella sp. LLJ827]
MARYKRRLAGTASGMAIMLMTMSSGSAQVIDEDGSVQLMPVVIEGSADEGGAGEGDQVAPATSAETVLTTRVTRAELDAAQIDDPDDISRLDPGVSYNEATRSFNVRGLDSSRVLTTIDGIRVPWLEDGARGVTGGPSSFDFDTLSGLDIVKGADSSVFGAGALGGVVALRTLNPEDLLKDGKNFGGLSRLSYDSKDDSWGVDQALAARFGETYMMIQGGYRDGHEIENQGTVDVYGADRTAAEPLDYDQKNLLVKLRQHMGVDQVLGFTVDIYDREDDIDSRTSSATTYAPGSARNVQVEKRKRVSANYELGPDAGLWLDAADVVIYWQRQDLADDFYGTRLTTPAGDYARLSDIQETNVGIAGSVLKRFDFGGVTHGVSVGGELFESHTEQYAAGEDSCPPPPYSFAFYTCNFLHTNQADMPEVEGTTLGLFIQDEIALTERFRLTPGVRFDYYEENPQETAAYLANPTVTGLPAASSDSAISPKLRGEYDVFDGVSIYGQWAQSFRAPTAAELYLSYGGPGTYLALGNPDLEPETSNGFEAGIELGDAVLGGKVAGFYNRYKNFIDQVSVDPASVGIPAGAYPFGITQYINRASVEIYGVEASAHWQITPEWHTGASFAAYVGRDRETDEHLNSIPAMKGILNLGYDNGMLGADAYLTLAAARDDVESDINRTPSYALLDLTAWYKPTQIEGLKLSGGVYNVFDETYYDALDIPDSATQQREFYSEAGRTFKAALTYEF